MFNNLSVNEMKGKATTVNKNYATFEYITLK